MKALHLILPVTLAALLVVTVELGSSIERYWGLLSLVMLGLLLLDFLVIFNEKVEGSKDIALIAILGSISAAARVPFAGIPSVQPSTFIIMTAGMVFGAYVGCMVGFETALLSNFLLGQGPWTPWQMLAWGLAGVLGAALRFTSRTKHGIYIFMAVAFLYGYVYGIIMNIWYWLAFIYPHTIESFLLVWTLSLYFDTMHAVGNLIFVDLFGHKLIKIFKRYKSRFTVNHGARTSVEICSGN